MIGSTLGHFRILGHLGSGGMGEVYRAEDAKLGRQVAIKVLPEAFSDDPDRLQRFDREARVLASLNHPSIASIHEVGEEGGRHFLVMELVAGQTLAERLHSGPIPVAEALPIALQIARALEAAHGLGIVHRDLKPANVKVTGDGEVKVLDFGLAKALAPEPLESAAELADSPTLTFQHARMGALIGTAAYMSPEQALGKPVDTRADNWAFGVVLWEMLTGRRLFAGDSAPEVLAEVIKSTPDLRALPGDTPPPVMRLIDRCLRKEASSRLRDMGDARIVLEDVLADRDPAPAPMARPRSGRVAQAAALLAALAVGLIIGYVLLRPRAPAAEVSRLAIALEASLRATRATITADGRTVVYSAFDTQADPAGLRERLYVQRLDRSRPSVVRDSEGVRSWSVSPDGRLIAFETAGDDYLTARIWKAALDADAPPVLVTELRDTAIRNLLWTRDDVLLAPRLFTMTVLRLPVDGRPPLSPVEGTMDRPVSNPARLELTEVLPDGRHALVGVGVQTDKGILDSIGILDLETGDVRTLIDDAEHPLRAPSGELLFYRDGVLLATRFDATKGVVVGAPTPLEDDLWSARAVWSRGGRFGVATTGTMVYLVGSTRAPRRRLVTIDRDGDIRDWHDQRLVFTELAVSPSGDRVAIAVCGRAGECQIRVSEFDRPHLTPFTNRPGWWCDVPVWAPDERSLLYGCSAGEHSKLFLKPLGGGGDAIELLAAEEDSAILGRALTRDGRYALVEERDIETWIGRQFLVGTTGQGRSADDPALPWGDQRFEWVTLSPDGQWIAYGKRGTGSYDLFVRALAQDWSLGSPLFVASVDPDSWPLFQWGKSAAGEPPEVVFQGVDRRLRAATVYELPEPHLSEPRETSVEVDSLRFWDTLPDGGILATLVGDEEIGAARLHLVFNWTAELERRMNEQSPR